MKKISLAIDELKVTSFDTKPQVRDPRGTVHGHATRLACNPTVDTCQQGSCDYTCDVLLTGNPCVGC